VTMLQIALDCIKRGWYVFPCFPRSKKPATNNGFKSATLDEDTVRSWWDHEPLYNVAVATGPSGLCVVDVDHGLESLDSLDGWLSVHGLPYTYMVRTGRRPEFGVQLYYSGTGLKSTGWRLEDSSGDIRCATGYVMAAGSIHPSGEAYEVLVEALVGPITAVPDAVKALTIKANDPSIALTVDDETADAWKTWLLEYMGWNEIDARDYEKRVPNGWWLGITCPWTDEHQSGPGAESSTVLGILDGKIAFECSHGTCKANRRDTAAFKEAMKVNASLLGGEPGADPSVTLGTGLPTKKTPEDWRSLFHCRKDILDCPPPTFFIEDFLAKQAICALAAPVAQRKSLIALNVARSLCTGAPLFGFLPVLNRPARVLYLCPEMGLISLSERVRRIGLTDAVGETLFIRSMNLGNLDLLDIPAEALRDSVLIVDTAIRFMKGDENSSADMQAFSEVLFNVQRLQGPDGAIIVLYHSPKATKDASELTLENCMRGSGELGAAITDAHGTRLQTPDDPYRSASFIRHIKQRDYKGIDDYEIVGEDSGLLTRSGEGKAVLSVNTGFKGNRDGRDDSARAVVAANPTKSLRELVDMLEVLGIKRGKSWVSDARIAAKGTGSKLTG
jgi:Bifunctional DNA primase/polymerase, N-terminal/AAA domain